MNLSRSSTQSRFDVVVVGGGHNGLTCACYLAKTGLSVGVFERRSVLGGAAVTEEFHPGFRNSTASYTVSLLNPKVIRDLRLEQHGLKVLERPMQNFLPLPDGRALTAGPAQANTLASVQGFSARDADRLPAYFKMLDAAVQLLRRQLLETPPADSRRLRDLWTALKIGRHFRKLAPAVQRDIHELFTRSAGDLLDHWFETDAVKALYGFDAVVGNFASPYTPGSGYVLLAPCIRRSERQDRRLGPRCRRHGRHYPGDGDRGTASRSHAGNRRAREKHSHLARIRHGHRARGRTCHRGRRHRRQRGAEAALPGSARRCGPAHRVPRAHPAFSRRIGDVPHERGAVGAAEIHRCTAQRRRCTSRFRHHHRAVARIHGSRLRRCPPTGMSRAPIVEMLIPSTLDTTLAPKGAHVASLFCQHFAYKLPDGRDWRQERQRAIDLIFATVDSYAPNFRASVVGHSALSPVDLENILGLAGGDIFHGALGLDQLWAARPMLGYGDYRTPLKRLYLCGAGAHPGGGVTGIPGHNAAREMLRDGLHKGQE